MAPPPWAPFPPYVSTMIFLPVNPVSPCGPPITNLPVGLIWYLMLLLKSLAYFLYFDFTLGIKILMISFLIWSSIFGSVSKSSCWVDTTMASMRTGCYYHRIPALPGFLHQDAGILSVCFRGAA